MRDLSADVVSVIRDIPDFPKPGILFKDITPILSDPRLFDRVIDWMAALTRPMGVTKVVGMESRGFIFGAPLAPRIDAGFVPARKPGKLPYETIGVSYDLEYGSARLEMHADAIRPGEKVVIVDDLLATGGTAAATLELVRKLGGTPVACVFVVELSFLDGAQRLDVPVHALVRY